MHSDICAVVLSPGMMRLPNQLNILNSLTLPLFYYNSGMSLTELCSNSLHFEFARLNVQKVEYIMSLYVQLSLTGMKRNYVHVMARIFFPYGKLQASLEILIIRTGNRLETITWWLS